MIASFALLGFLLPICHAHGYLKQVVAGGVTNPAPAPWDSYSKLPNTASRIGYSSDASRTYCLFPSDFNNAEKMSCGPSSRSGAPGTVKVAAGSSVDLYWAGSTGELKSFSRAPNGFFPFVHAMGPVIDYLASCDGDCSSFDATNAGWTKMAQFGVDKTQTISQELRGLMAAKPEVYHPKSGPGLWGMAKMIDDGSKWTLNIPEDLAPGQYLWRNEISATHSNPAQIYVGCVQLEVTGNGKTALPAGITSDKFYTSSSSPLNGFNTYTYDYSNTVTLPGPPVWDGAATSSSTNTTGTVTSTDDLDEPDTTTTSSSNETPNYGSSSSGSSGGSSGYSGNSGGSGSSGNTSSGYTSGNTKSGKSCMKKRQSHKRRLSQSKL